ncbi:MAG: SDR family NAD(P)-dependent oxidoreductase [Candidatus Hermodarchaeota archaeon]
MKLLEGKAALITGAGRGIGREEALVMAKEGCNLIINDLGCSLDGTGSDHIVDEVVKDVKKLGVNAVANYDDISNYKKAKSMLDQAISEFGKLDILVNNAGIIRDRMSYNMSEEEFDTVINVNLKGTFNMCRHAASYFKKKWKENRKFSGQIINASSDAGLLGNLGQINYGASKAGIAAMTLILSGELKRFTTVNCVVQIARTRFTMSTPQIAEIMRKKDKNGFDIFNPLNVTPIVIFLASDQAKKINGEVFRIAGDKCWIYRGWYIVNKIENDGKMFTPQILGEKIKTELLKGIPKKQTVMDMMGKIVEM